MRKSTSLLAAVVLAALFGALIVAPVVKPVSAQTLQQQSICQIAKVIAQYNNDGNVGFTYMSNSARTAVCGYVLTNVNSGYTCYVHFYDVAANPTIGTTVPVLTVAVPASTTVSFNPNGYSLRFNKGIAWAVSKGYSDTDTTHALAGDVVGFITYR